MKTILLLAPFLTTLSMAEGLSNEQRILELEKKVMALEKSMKGMEPSKLAIKNHGGETLEKSNAQRAPASTGESMTPEQMGQLKLATEQLKTMQEDQKKALEALDMEP